LSRKGFDSSKYTLPIAIFFSVLGIIGDLESSKSPENLSMENGEGFVRNPLFHTKPRSIFHILDSLGTNPVAVEEPKQLQNILLKYFEGENFKKGRITATVPQVHLIILSSLITSDQSNERCLSSPTAQTVAVSPSISRRSFLKTLLQH
jgi:hypothetical protein